MNLTLVFCPQYASEGTPLGIAYINAVLRRAGHRVIPFDLETLLVLENAPLYKDLYDMINIGLENNTVHFILRLDVLLWSLYEEDVCRYAKTVTEKERQIILKIKKIVDRYATLVVKTKPDAVLFSVFIGSVFFSLLMAKAIHNAYKNVPIIFGGPGCSRPEVAELLLRTGYVDCCVIGEGEQTVTETISRLEKGKEFAGIRGAAVIQDERLSYIPRPLIDLADMPYPDFSGFPFPGANFRTYLIKYNRLSMPVSSSRGCTLRCAFCSESAFWRRFRRRAPEDVADEILHQMKRYKTNIFFFCDSLLNSTEEWLNELCDILLYTGKQVIFDFAYLQGRFLSTKTIRKMARVGFRDVSIGVESGSQSLLTRMGKGTDVEEMERIILDMVSNKIQCGFSILAHLPGETRDDVWQNIDFIYTLERHIPESMRQYLYYYVGTRFRVEPYARVFRNPEAYGIAVEPYSMDIPERAECLGDSLKRILLRWKDQLSSKEKELRYQLYLRHHHGSSITSYFRDYATPLKLNDQLKLSRNVEISEVKRGGTHRYRLSNLYREVPLSEVGYRILRQIQQMKKVGDILDWTKGVYPDQESRVQSSLMRFLDHLVQSELVGFSLSPSMIADKQALEHLCLPKKHSVPHGSSANNVESQRIENFNDTARDKCLDPG